MADEVAPLIGRDAAIAAIKFEIEIAEKDRQRPGWNSWLLMAGAAAVGWKLLQAFASGAVHWTAVRWVVVFGLGIHAVALLFAALRTAVAPPVQPGRYQPLGRLVVEEVESFAFGLFMLTSLIVLVMVADVGQGTFWLVATFLLVSFALLAWVALWRSAAVSTTVPRGFTSAVLAVMAVWAGAGAAALVFRNVQVSAALDIEHGALLAALGFLLSHSIASYRVPALVLDLRRVQRELAFGRMAPEVALRSADLLIHGGDFYSILQAELRTVVGLHELQGALVGQIRDGLAALKAIPADTTASDREAIKHALGAKVIEEVRVERELSAAMDALVARMNRVFRFAPDANTDMNRVLGHLSDILRRSRTAIDEIEPSLRAAILPPAEREAAPEPSPVPPPRDAA
jgi:hypothetical protein